jgi:hypothetical protein
VCCGNPPGFQVQAYGTDREQKFRFGGIFDARRDDLRWYNSAMLLYAQLLILLVLAILNTWFGIVKSAYTLIWWWDIPTHLLGGIWVGLFAAWFLQKRDKKFTVLKCAAAALAVGIVWEIFEYHFGIGGSAFMGYWEDTIKDVTMDVIGGAAAGLGAMLQRDLWKRK